MIYSSSSASIQQVQRHTIYTMVLYLISVVSPLIPEPQAMPKRIRRQRPESLSFWDFPALLQCLILKGMADVSLQSHGVLI